MHAPSIMNVQAEPIVEEQKKIVAVVMAVEEPAG